MYVKDERYMRIFVFFDLPVANKKDRQAASRFRRDLLKCGYYMLQLSVYYRICKGQDSVDCQIERLKSCVPHKGSVRLLTVTDAQYARMLTLVGTQKIQENTQEQLLLF